MPIRRTSLEFKADLKEFAQRIDQDYALVVKTVVFELFRKIVLRTPVDTGRAAGNWNVSRNVIGSEISQTGSRADAMSKLGKVTFDPPEGVYWIYNNLPYIQVLEFGLYPNPPAKGSYVKGQGYVVKSSGGFSVQAPQGMVRVSIAEMHAEIEGILRRVAGKK